MLLFCSCSIGWIRSALVQPMQAEGGLVVVMLKCTQCTNSRVCSCGVTTKSVVKNEDALVVGIGIGVNIITVGVGVISTGSVGGVRVLVIVVSISIIVIVVNVRIRVRVRVFVLALALVLALVLVLAGNGVSSINETAISTSSRWGMCLCVGGLRGEQRHGGGRFSVWRSGGGHLLCRSRLQILLQCVPQAFELVIAVAISVRTRMW